MKKLLVGLGVCILLFILYVYVFIPDDILLTTNISVPAKRDGLYRNLVNEENWTKWWPGQKNNSAQKIFLFNGNAYTIEKIQISSLIISIAKNNSTIKTSLLVVPDSENVKIVWEGKMYTTHNPLRRLQIYRQNKELKRDMSYILKTMQSYLSKDENVYGINISKERVVDSILIFKNAVSKGFPSTGFIYALITDLEKYINNNSARVTGFPMLNINTSDSINYLVKVAVPVDKTLPSSGNTSTKLMPGGGKILVTEVKGSYTAINRAFSQLKNYADDYNRIAPAIPFQSLVTDRSKEPDSTKWITRIYYPVM